MSYETDDIDRQIIDKATSALRDGNIASLDHDDIADLIRLVQAFDGDAIPIGDCSDDDLKDGRALVYGRVKRYQFDENGLRIGPEPFHWSGLCWWRGALRGGSPKSPGNWTVFFGDAGRIAPMSDPGDAEITHIRRLPPNPSNANEG